MHLVDEVGRHSVQELVDQVEGDRPMASSAFARLAIAEAGVGPELPIVTRSMAGLRLPV